MMKSPLMLSSCLCVLSLLLLFSWPHCSAYNNDDDHSYELFAECFFLHKGKSLESKGIIFNPNDAMYFPLLNFSIQNLRFASPESPKPGFLVTPFTEQEVQAAISCAKEHDIELRVRCGGHDFEGLSYTTRTDLPPKFVVLDMFNFRSVDVDVKTGTAWVQGGATQGELYYAIAKASKTLAFPGGAIASVGVGGFISGGGFGTLARKYGVAADTVIDARFMDVNGNILDKDSMGADLFWAIRGGGGGNFGVILAWKLQLVEVPETVTVFTVPRTLQQNATELAYRWQHIAHKLDKDLFIRIRFRRTNTTTFQASFQALFLGTTDRLLPMMQESFPELGVSRNDCMEMSWIQSILYFGGYGWNSSLDVLLNRDYEPKIYFKAKSDYVKEPIPQNVLEGIWDLFYEQDPQLGDLVWLPYGGKMEEIPESEIPYPHRAGNLYEVYEAVYWFKDNQSMAEKQLKWITSLHHYLTDYVSTNPREAYVNHRDLDLGRRFGHRSHDNVEDEAKIWGPMYFKNNFERLVLVKTKVDPENFFRNAQSIPLLRLRKQTHHH